MTSALFKKFTFLFITTPLFFGTAQNSTEIDSTRIISYADKFVVKLNVDNLTDSYSLRNLMDGSNLQIKPNIGYNFFISLDYQFLGLSFGASPSLFGIDKENDLKGESTYSEFRFRAALGRWIQGFQVSSVEGFYVENTGDFIPGWIEGKDPYIQLTDCKSQRGGCLHPMSSIKISLSGISSTTPNGKNRVREALSRLFFIAMTVYPIP